MLPTKDTHPKQTFSKQTHKVGVPIRLLVASSTIFCCTELTNAHETSPRCAGCEATDLGRMHDSVRHTVALHTRWPPAMHQQLQEGRLVQVLGCITNAGNQPLWHRGRADCQRQLVRRQRPDAGQ